VGPADIPGRWLRVVNSPGHVENEIDREVSDPAEAAAVRAGWLLVDAHERLSRVAALEVFGHELDAWHRYADDTMALLKDPSSSGATVPETETNRLRFRRTMDFAQSGDRVFDVGFGRGYLASQLMKERGIEAYHGIDVGERYLPFARAVFEANGLENASIDLEIGDLFDLTRAKVAATGANLMICCEVLEHVDDAEHALRTLAEALPDGADLLFSVPLHGRIESTWGHLSVFDVARLKHMLDGAGLHAHHVEPLANAWTLVVASRSPEPSQRVREATGRPPLRVSTPLVRQRSFVQITADDMSAVGDRESTSVEPDVEDPEKVGCRLASGGGVSFPVAGLEAVRVLFDAVDCQGVMRIDVTAYAGSTQVGEWSLKLLPGGLRKRVHRYSMRPGETGVSFVGGPHHDLQSADRVEVTMVLEQGSTAEFGFKAAYLP
jgi:2-polyprenyl-3-methyl-5-hydroxy-6-metoxy-1,4-benzoquinol methylase